MKTYFYIGFLFFSLVSFRAFSQVADSIFEKDVFMIRNYNGKRSFIKPPVKDPVKAGEKSFSVRIDDGPVRYSIVPDPGKRRLALYVDDRFNNECYYYNEVFLTTGFDENLKYAKDENNVYLRAKSGKVVKMWRIKAIWKRKTVSKKPEWFSDWAPDLLTFNEYHIYTLQKLISINAITTNEGDDWISVGKNVELGPYN